MAFLHYQERKLRNKPNSAETWSNAYYMPGTSNQPVTNLQPVVFPPKKPCKGESDRSIGAWRQWLAKVRALITQYCELPGCFFAVLPDHPIESHLNQLKRVKHESPAFFPENSSISFFEEEARCVDPEAGGCGDRIPKCPGFAMADVLVGWQPLAQIFFFKRTNKTRKGKQFPV